MEFLDGQGFTLPQLIYSGQMVTVPRDMYGFAPGAWHLAYMYQVFGGDLEALYVGYTASPYNRWCAHRRTARWWSRAAVLNLFEVVGKDRNCADNGARHWESLAIRELLPEFNLHGPAELPSKAARR